MSGEVSFRLDGRLALVTGGTRNNGLAIARALGRAGARIALLFAHDWDTARTAQASLAQDGIEAALYAADLSDVAATRRACAALRAQAGPVDVLVNCAAVRPRAKITDVTPEEWDMVLATNLRAPFFLSQALLPDMVARAWGRIVNIGGLDTYWAKATRPHVVASKAGLVGLTRALANEVAHFGITVNTVVPGRIESVRAHPEWYPDQEARHEKSRERVPLARLGEHTDVAGACVFLASPAGGYITGQELLVTGGAHPLLRHPEDEYPAGAFGSVPPA